MATQGALSHTRLQYFHGRPLELRSNWSLLHRDFPQFHLETVGRTILRSGGKLTNRGQGHAQFILSDPHNKVLQSFRILERSGGKPPDSRQFVVTVGSTHRKNEVALSNQNGDRAFDRPGHVTREKFAASPPAARCRAVLYQSVAVDFRTPYEISMRCNREAEQAGMVRDDTSLRE